MIRIGGINFEFEPASGLTPAEHAYLTRFTSSGPGEPVRVRLSSLNGAADSMSEEIRVQWNGDAIVIDHWLLDARIREPFDAAEIWRRTDSSSALQVLLRTVLACRLPFEGGVPLHAAGLVVDGKAIAFFGPSGAGKSTIASRSGLVVLSDELVVARTGPARAQAAGFWGELGDHGLDEREYPLGALVELRKGGALSVEPQDPRVAMKRVLSSLLVPPAPPAWGRAITVLARLLSEVPCLRLTWSLQHDPDEVLRSIAERTQAN